MRRRLYREPLENLRAVLAATDPVNMTLPASAKNNPQITSVLLIGSHETTSGGQSLVSEEHGSIKLH
ncbi:hypothetical protein ABTK87_19325, partial [Acinetobacter baumannii]